ncbi:MAG: putative sulfate exporter family transporter, partial [Phycisphaerae bacterium]|nr:putative sulfate exporter family transporter [Phycisphaerae bacterium]
MTRASPDLSKYAWADYLHCMDGLPDPILLPSGSGRRPGAEFHWIWGLAVAGAIAAGAIVLAGLPFAPFTLANGRQPLEPVMIAILLGMLVANLLPRPPILQPGLKITAKRLLPVAVVLLGARLDFLHLLRAGAAGLVLSLLTILGALALFVLFIRRGWIERKLGLLLGLGTAICGATAIVAAAPVIDARQKDVAFAVATVTLCGLLTMFLLPVIGASLGMSDSAFGIWAGLSIHQTPQVVAAGFGYSQSAGDTAVIVKLARVSLLAPVLLAVAWFALHEESMPRERAAVSVHGLFPMFILGFLAMALARTCGLLPEVRIHLPGSELVRSRFVEFNLGQLCETISKVLMVVAMAAVGLETRLSALRQTGTRPLL